MHAPWCPGQALVAAGHDRLVVEPMRVFRFFQGEAPIMASPPIGGVTADAGIPWAIGAAQHVLDGLNSGIGAGIGKP